jgi:hypothetical protein
MSLTLVRVALIALVVAWLFDVAELQAVLPIWAVFLIALGLEVHFFVNALRPAPFRRPDRGPQPIDRERYGFPVPEELEGEDVWEELPEPEPEPEERVWPWRQLLVGLGVIAVLAVLIWVVDVRSGWDELDEQERREAVARFSDEGSRIAGKPVRIRCDESGEFVGAVQHADGVAEVGGDLAFLTPERCFDLYRLAFDGEERGAQTGRALAVLAHEAWHLRGVSDEGATECYALQSGVALGRRLGLAEGTARRLMRQQLVENQLRRGEALEYRVPADCRDGGPLDLDRTSSEFP